MAEIVIRLLDVRVGARFDKPKPTDIVSGETTPLDYLFRKIKETAGANKIKLLQVVAHGYELPIEDEDAAISYQGGGYGIQLGESITIRNVSKFNVLDGAFADGGIIEFRSCAVADVSKDQRGLTGNGRRLMGEIATYANATVRASDTVQHAAKKIGVESFLWFSWYEGVEVGPWEGNVWLFSPGQIQPKKEGSYPIR
jgi:hypothetical protein